MSIWKLLGFKGAEKQEDGLGDTDTVRKVATRLEAIPPEEARYVAAFAYVLARVAYADRDISADEIDEMEFLVEEYGGLSEAQAKLVVELVKSQAELFAGTENFLVTRELGEIATREQREYLLHCLFAVAAADDVITLDEEKQIRQIAKELGFFEYDFISVRREYNDKRSVVQADKA